jgi:intracellular multiplication protein IcmL
MTQDAMIAIISRNAFYRRLHYYALAVLLIALVVIGIMIGMLYYISGNYNHPLYFATDNVGRLIQIIPVSEPNMSDDDVTAWAMEAVQSAYSYDYVNFHSQLQGAQKYFTEYGWSKYMDALVASNNLVALERRKMVAIATVVDKPTILKKGLLPSGAYAWRIQMPVLVTYLLPPYDDTQKFNNPLDITVIVQRQPILQSYKGLGVVQLVGAIASAPVNTPAPVSTTPP